MIFEEMPQTVQKQVGLKLMCLIAHLECAIDLVDELSFHPEVHRFKQKKSAETFKTEAGLTLKNLLYAFKSKDMDNTDAIQLDVFAMIKKIKELNMEAISNTSEELYEA